MENGKLYQIITTLIKILYLKYTAQIYTDG